MINHMRKKPIILGKYISSDIDFKEAFEFHLNLNHYI